MEYRVAVYVQAIMDKYHLNRDCIYYFENKAGYLCFSIDLDTWCLREDKVVHALEYNAIKELRELEEYLDFTYKKFNITQQKKYILGGIVGVIDFIPSINRWVLVSEEDTFAIEYSDLSKLVSI